MTDRSPSPEELHDPHLDALWRAASSEEPPAAIDTALSALARREAGAASHIRVAAAAPKAQSKARAWWPLAAAATIGALALGIVQMFPQEEAERVIVSDMPAKPSAPRPKAIENAPSQGTHTTPLEEDEEARSKMKPRALFPGSVAGTPANKLDAVPSKAIPAPKAVGGPLSNSRDAAAGKVDDGRSFVPDPKQGAEAPASGMLSRRMREEKVVPEIESPRSMDTDARSLVRSAPPSASANGSAVQDARARENAPASPALGSGSEMDAKKIARDQMAAQRPAAFPAASDKAATQPMPLAKARADRNATDETASAGRVVLPDAEWIALIRRLRDEGRIEEAKRELAAFRAAHADAERLLPKDVRDWQPPKE